MAIICNSCFEADTGILPSTDYPYSTTFEQPDRLYCVGNQLVAPPSRGAVAPLSNVFTLEPTSVVGPSSALSARSDGSISWTNYTARACSVFAIADGSLVGDAGAGFATYSSGVTFALNIRESGGTSDNQTVDCFLRDQTGLGLAVSVPFSLNSGALVVQPGLSVFVNMTAAMFDSSPGGNANSISGAAAKIVLFGATSMLDT